MRATNVCKHAMACDPVININGPILWAACYSILLCYLVPATATSWQFGGGNPLFKTQSTKHVAPKTTIRRWLVVQILYLRPISQILLHIVVVLQNICGATTIRGRVGNGNPLFKTHSTDQFYTRNVSSRIVVVATTVGDRIGNENPLFQTYSTEAI